MSKKQLFLQRLKKLKLKSKYIDMQKVVLLGDEAIAQGAIDAGLSGVFAYPGTPSTEITEYIQASKEATEKGIRSKWSANEKTAVEAALGMSYAGKRVITCMKHVGLNVAADCFVNTGVTGVNGGMIVVVADDPSMHSSQNEQDSRFYAKFAMIPCLEPSNQQEAYDMVHYAFDFSEKTKLPVLMRITTRMAHSRSGVACKEKREQNQIHLPEDPTQFVLLPVIARRKNKALIAIQDELEEAGEKSGFNKYIDGKDKSLGIIASGIGYNYLMENFQDGCPYPVLKISQYPLPKKMIAKLVKECDKILVLEEGQPVIEEQLRGVLNFGINVLGRLDNTVSRDGELNPNMIAQALGLKDTIGENIPELVAPRPPKLCDGCPHISSYLALNKAIEPYGKGRVFADIGCYTLGFLPPYQALNSCVDMGASITMAKGAADAGLNPAVAVIGDSTFTHSGMTGLLDCVNDGANVTVMILDNETAGMTGGQDSSAWGKIEQICFGLGVEKEHIRVVNPLPRNVDEIAQIIGEELKYQGVSVIVPRRICLQVIGKKAKKQ